MYIINTSFMVEPPVHDRWYEFMTGRFVERVWATGFEGLVFSRLLAEQNEGHYTYSLQIRAADISEYQRFMEVIMAEYDPMVGDLFEGKVLHFTSLLKIIEL